MTAFWDRHTSVKLCSIIQKLNNTEKILCYFGCQFVQAEGTETVYTVSQKKQDTKLLPITSANVNRFSKFFHWQTHW